MQIEFLSQEAFIGFAIISMIVILLIATLRIYYNSSGYQMSIQKGDRFSKSVKFSSVDVFRHTKRLFAFAFSVSLLTVICGFSWTTSDRSFSELGYLSIQEDYIRMEPPIVSTLKSPIPPTPPMAPARIEEDIAQIFKVVERTPLFGRYADQTCSDNALFKYSSKHLKYQNIAKQNGVQGKLFIQFVVDKDGSLIESKIARNDGAVLGKESLRMIQKTNELPRAFGPNRQTKEALKNLFTVPIPFKLMH